ncbi:DUF6891 domain-containing protein [Nonomuraea sp. SBT364]|uniref:DUF6891 domain-containing protein n=1 Tax=Nonomuraea sp. SBT364 TaxID=1580530 RepID=UPI00066C1DE0|nr:hypothetical protein [Nonomuraea sp. SBT364]
MITDLREIIRFHLALGQDSHGAILNQCADHLGDSTDVSSIVAEEFESYLDDQRTWPDILDSDRLLRAFGDLNTTGIVARTDFACCLTCGTNEIGGEVPSGQERRGHVFAHRQDMEAAVAGFGCHLAFGSFDAGTSAEIGEEIVTTLQRHGLVPDWSGDPTERIDVPLTWRRRRFGRLATWPGGRDPEDTAPQPLQVFYCGYRGRVENAQVPMSLAEARNVLLELAPYEGNFAGFIGRSEGCVQVAWTRNGHLSLDSPDPANRLFRRRDVSMTEAENMITILADEDRVAIDELGELTIEHWS